MATERVITEVERLRLAKGWSREKLAVETGLAFATIERIESGRRTPQLTTAVKIARALGVGLDELFPPASEVAS